MSHRFEDGFNGEFGEYRINELSEFVNSGSVLEIGCGEGTITKFLLGVCRRVVSIEPDARAFEVAKSLGAETHNVRFEDFETQEKFDYVIATGVLEHIEDDKAFVNKVKRFLKPLGKFIVTVPNSDSLHRQIGLEMGIIQDLKELGELDRKVGHYRYYDDSSLCDLMLKNGFWVTSLRGIFLKALPQDEMQFLPKRYRPALYRLGKKHPSLCAEIFCVAEMARLDA